MTYTEICVPLQQRLRVRHERIKEQAPEWDADDILLGAAERIEALEGGLAAMEKRDAEYFDEVAKLNQEIASLRTENAALLAAVEAIPANLESRWQGVKSLVISQAAEIAALRAENGRLKKEIAAHKEKWNGGHTIYWDCNDAESSFADVSDCLDNYSMSEIVEIQEGRAFHSRFYVQTWTADESEVEVQDFDSLQEAQAWLEKRNAARAALAGGAQEPGR